VDYAEYRKSFFAEPAPEPRFDYKGLYGITLFFEEFEAAVEYYSRVFGPPAYVEGAGTRGWRIGNTWLTLLKGRNGTPQNVELSLVMKDAIEAERLQAAFIEAGSSGPDPSDQLMYEPVHICPVSDPFGTEILIVSPPKE
jgi:hypothetical protein